MEDRPREENIEARKVEESEECSTPREEPKEKPPPTVVHLAPLELKGDIA